MVAKENLVIILLKKNKLYLWIYNFFDSDTCLHNLVSVMALFGCSRYAASTKKHHNCVDTSYDPNRIPSEILPFGNNFHIPSHQYSRRQL